MLRYGYDGGAGESGDISKVIEDIELFPCDPEGKRVILSEHLIRISRSLQTLCSIISECDQLLALSSRTSIIKAKEDVIGASEVLIEALNRLKQLAFDRTNADEGKGNYFVSSSQGTPPIVRAMSLGAGQASRSYSPPLSAPAAIPTNLSAKSIKFTTPSSSKPNSVLLKTPKLVAVSKATAAARVQSSQSFSSAAHIKFDHIFKPVTKHVADKQIVRSDFSALKQCESGTNSEPVAEITNSSPTVNVKDKSRNSSDHHAEEPCGETTAAGEVWADDAAEKRSDHEKNNSEKSPKSPGFLYPIKSNEKASITHSAFIDGCLYRFVLSAKRYGKVTVEPAMTEQSRSQFLVCFCGHRTLQDHVDYVFCVDGRVCNHFVHLSCADNEINVRRMVLDYDNYTCHMCLPAVAPSEEELVSSSSNERVLRPKRKHEECISLSGDEECAVVTEMSQASVSSSSRGFSFRRDRMQGMSKTAVKVEKVTELLTLRYECNRSAKAGKSEHLLSVLVNNKPVYISLSNGFFGFPCATVSREVKARMCNELCFCSPKPKSSRNFSHMNYVFCARGIKCNHLVHKSCLGITREMSETFYRQVFTADFVCDGCSVAVL